MIKLRKVDLIGFRGVRFKLSLDFKKEARSISIYGENGSGKSSVTDALEWLIKGKVDHLWREDCNESSLRNVLLDATEKTSVAVELTNSTQNTKELDSNLTVSDHNKTKQYKELIAALREENIFLRHADVTEFIQMTKNQKRTAIASIIGYESISDFRSTIQSSLNSLQKDDSYIASRRIVEDQKRIFLELTGQFISKPQELFSRITHEIKVAGFEIDVADDGSYDSAVKGLRQKINQEERLEQRLQLDALTKEISRLELVIANLDGAFDFVTEYDTLVANKDNVGQIHFQHFLASGVRVIEGGHADDDACPFCLSPYNLEQLKSQTETRLQAISHISHSLSIASTAVTAATSALSQFLSASNQIVTQFSKIEAISELRKNIENILSDAASLKANLENKFEQKLPIGSPANFLEKIKLLSTNAHAGHEHALEQIEGLQFTEYENKIVALIERIRELRDAYQRYEKHSTILAAFQEQILTLGHIFDEFLIVQNTAMQAVLDEISNDVGTFYKALHPDENVDAVRLKVTGEEGIEFEYSFHGTATHPPTKYLSESHLNSLGVVLFLASARLFNQTSRFLILDDIVTSFDFNHRRRLLRLLKDEFIDWQIILLTHDAFWFEMIRKEMSPMGWICFEVASNGDNGATIDPSAADLVDLISQKRVKYDVSNDLRRLMEFTLKEICHSVGAKLAFRYNDVNEKRMNGELLSELQSTINRKCSSLKGNPIFANLAGSNLVISTGSHDNPEPISGGDIDVALEDIAALKNLFFCPSCKGIVDAQRAVPGQNTIACKCGATILAWKQ